MDRYRELFDSVRVSEKLKTEVRNMTNQTQNKKERRKIPALAILAAAFALGAFAIDTSIAYQGVLKNAAGTEAITGGKNITFALYTTATGGTPIWGRMVAVTLDDAGLFNVALSDAGGAALADGRRLYA